MNEKIMVVANSDWLLYQFRLPLLKRLEAEGLNVILVCPEGDYIDQLKDRGYRWLPWEMKRRSISPIKIYQALMDLVRYYRQFRPRAVHHITIQSIFYGSVAARLVGVPIVINNFTGLGFLFSEATGAFLLRQFTLPIMGWAMANENVFTVLLNEQDRQELVQRGLISEEETVVIPGEGVDLDRFYPREADEDEEDHVVILMAARLLWDKGVGEYVQAASVLKKKHQETRFLLAGAPDPGNPTSISRSKINDLKGQGVIEFLGYREDMEVLLRRADIAVLPSYHEGVPVFLLEAAAAGLPLVATDLEGCRMIIEPGVNGYLVPKGNVTDLVQALTRLIENPGLRKSMGKYSRQLVKNKYDQEQIVDEFIDLYQSLGILHEDMQQENRPVEGRR